MRCKFPYFENRPHIPIRIRFNDKKLRFLPLLDTGADYALFYKSDAIRLGLNWSKGKKIKLDNADGSPFHAKQFNLEIDIEGFTFEAQICFVENDRSAMPLLGRAGIFEHFKITIHEREKYVELNTQL